MADSNSPWGRKPSGGNSGNRGPVGGGNGGNSGGKGGKPPGGPNNPFEKLVRDAHSKMRDSIGRPPQEGNEAHVIVLIFAAIFALWLASGVYRVNSDELGIVLRFGQYSRTSTPGLNYHLPYPIESVVIPSVTTVNRVEIGYRAGGAENPNVRTARVAGYAAEAAGPQNHEGQMLTSDRNIVDIDFEVQWKIDAAHPQKYLFNMRNPAANVKPVAESAMREVIGRTKLDDVLTGAPQIAEDTKQLMQQVFNEYDAGIDIIAVNLSRRDVPAPVIDEFQDIKRAQQDKQTAESVAEGYRNDILPRAKGDAAKMLEDSQAYKSRVVADALGDASRFKQIYAQYLQAKDVTKRRMYLETMEAILKGMPKVVVDAASKSGSGVMSVLPLTLPSPSRPAPEPTKEN